MTYTKWGGAKRFITKILRRFIRWYYHCDIAGAAIIKGVYFCHEGFGVVIHPKARIGAGTVVQHRVTIGEKETDCVPVIGENCFIGAGAIILYTPEAAAEGPGEVFVGRRFFEKKK